MSPTAQASMLPSARTTSVPQENNMRPSFSIDTYVAQRLGSLSDRAEISVTIDADVHQAEDNVQTALKSLEAVPALQRYCRNLRTQFDQASAKYSAGLAKITDSMDRCTVRASETSIYTSGNAPETKSAFTVLVNSYALGKMTEFSKKYIQALHTLAGCALRLLDVYLDDNSKAVPLPLEAKASKLEPRVTSILLKFFYDHIAYPYPTKAEKRALAEETGLTVQQVGTWFGNKRMRSKKRVIDAKSQTVERTEEYVSDEPSLGDMLESMSNSSVSSDDTQGTVAFEISTNLEILPCDIDPTPIENLSDLALESVDGLILPWTIDENLMDHSHDELFKK
eukprot:TRINITY_DN37219_c0_g1_i1.p1 TRINITY_DN37219_c0_g1~~TRINITY_DN37219_c0_g1_i1.p1  ORF type:complete len:338 (+),score=26.10 TRINITY_DN37219_c0_g1_i1:146-1159(+)